MPFRLILALAWRNLWRTPRRSGFTILITLVGVMGVLVFGGFAFYTFESLKQMSARNTGNVIIGKPGYFTEQADVPLQYGFKPSKDFYRTINQLDEVRYALPSLNLSGLITNGQKSLVFIGKGMDPREFMVKGPFLYIKAGQLLSMQSGDEATPQVLLGSVLARQLKAKVGEGLTLMSTTVDGALNAIDVEVRGIISTGTPQVDERLVLMNIKDAQALLNTDKVSQVAVFLPKVEWSDRVAQVLKTKLPDYELKTWESQAHFYHKVRNLYEGIFGVIGVVVLVIVVFAISNTLSMIILERTREIGTLSALGTYPHEILSLFLSEAGLMAAIGSFLGVLFYGGISLALLFFPVQMPPPPGSSVGYPLQILFSPQLAVQVVAIVVLLSLLAALLSARKAVKQPIVEALRYV